MLIRRVKLFALFFMLLTIPLACEDWEVLFVDCDKCYTDKPEYARVTIKFTIDDENPYVVYTLFDGSIDDGNVIMVDTAYDSNVYWDLDVNRNYSAIAEYNCKGRTIYAVDGTKLRTKLDKSSCSDQCYIILGDRLDVRLKY